MKPVAQRDGDAPLTWLWSHRDGDNYLREGQSQDTECFSGRILGVEEVSDLMNGDLLQNPANVRIS